MEKAFFGSFRTSSRRIDEFGAGNTIVLQINDFGKKIKENTLALCLTEITARSSFTLLKMIWKLNRGHQKLQRSRSVSF